MSKIGRRPIQIPEGVKINKKDNVVLVEGPKGKLSFALPEKISIEITQASVRLKSASGDKQTKALFGLSRSSIKNMVTGVKDGFSKQLEIIGVGFKAAVQGKKLVLNLGFTLPVEYAIPEGITIETPKPTQIMVKGVDKAKVGEVASWIRGFLPPEPYKGKGIRYFGEAVRKKAGKTVA
jgi:large subunit ribosomal protein L6